MVSGKPARAARREVTGSNPRHESIHRGHRRGLKQERAQDDVYWDIVLLSVVDVSTTEY